MELRIATPELLKTVYRIHLQEAFVCAKASSIRIGNLWEMVYVS